MNRESDSNLDSTLNNIKYNESHSISYFFKSNILFFLTTIFVILCIFAILLFFILFDSKIENSNNTFSIDNTINSVQISDINENTGYAAPAKEEQPAADPETIGEMYAWYYFDRIIKPDYSGLLYDVDNDNTEEYIYEKNTEYFYKKYNGNKLITYPYLPANSLLSSFKNEELTEECRLKAAEYGYPDNINFTIRPDCALVGMTNIKSDSILLMSKPQENSEVLQNLPKGLFVNCLFFYDSEGNFSSDGAYNGTYSWSEIITNYNGSKIRGFIHADDLILDDKLK